MALAGGTGEQAVVADAMKALGQDVEQEAADELVGGQRHALLPVGTGAAVVLVAERHPASSKRRSLAFEIATRCV